VVISEANATISKNAGPPASGRKQIPDSIREIAVSIAIAIRTITVFALAIGFGLLLAMKFGHGNPWIAAGAAVGFLLFVVLPIRLWWTVARTQ
jgi:hypothetical protein